jgi:hypothetical protein
MPKRRLSAGRSSGIAPIEGVSLLRGLNGRHLLTEFAAGAGSTLFPGCGTIADSILLAVTALSRA